MAFMSVFLLMLVVLLPVVFISLALWIGAWAYVVFAIVAGAVLLWGSFLFKGSGIYISAQTGEGWKRTLSSVVRWGLLLFGILYLVSGVLVGVGAGTLAMMLAA